MAKGKFVSGDTGVRHTGEELYEIWKKQTDHAKLASRITGPSFEVKKNKCIAVITQFT